MPDYIVTKQITVTAETPEEAAAKSVSEGKTIAITGVALRPQSVQRPVVNPALAARQDQAPSQS